MKLIELLDQTGYDPDEIEEILRRDCADFIATVDHPFYRGVISRGEEVQPGIYQKEARKTRKALHSDSWLHTALDKASEKNFGVKARSEGVFAAKSPVKVRIYGEVYRFFPIGKLDYIWSPTIIDAFNLIRVWSVNFKKDKDIQTLLIDYAKSTGAFAEANLTDLKRESYALEKLSQDHPKIWQGMLEKFLDEKFGELYLHNTGINKVNAETEVMFLCDSYYLVNMKVKLPF